MLEELAKKEEARLQGFMCPCCGHDYGPFVKPLFERTRRRPLRLECASCFRKFVLNRDGITHRAD